MANKKDISIETVRGLALILMVAAHVIGADPTEGMRMETDSFWSYIYYTLIHIRMPLFTVISGYVYGLKPVDRNSNLPKFLKGKVRRLLFPLITISTIQFLAQYYVPGVNSDVHLEDMWRIYFFSYSHFWFIQAIFLIFLFIAVLDYFNVFSTPVNWFLVLSLSGIAFLTLYISCFFSLCRAFYLLPFFILGYGIKKFEPLLFNNKIIVTGVLVLFVSTYTLYQYNYFIGERFDGRNSLIGLFIGLSATFLLLKFRFKNRFLAYIGYYSYGIFLLHLFGSASSRIFLELLHLDKNKFVVFVIGLSFGIAVPIVMQYFILKFGILKTLLLGLKQKQNVNEQAS